MNTPKRKDAERPDESNTQKPDKGIATNFAESYAIPKKWYEELPGEPIDFEKVTEGTLIELKDEARKCNDAEVAAYTIKNNKYNSDHQWMKTVMAKGTISDKIAAYILLIQEVPVCNLSTLRNLINMVKVGKKQECLVVMDTLSELFISDLLRPYSILKPFYERPLSKLDELTSGSAVAKRKYLSLWYFEDQLKECYTLFVQALNTAAHDAIDANKEKAINAMYRLLTGNPEQEKNLLSNIVNKLGDPSLKVASKAIYCLGQVLREHSNMKQVVLNEIERLLFRPNVPPKAQYYGICFLNQFCLDMEDYKVAKNLIGIYFAFFKGSIKKGDVDSRMMSALLIGVNRAYPYAKSELTKISEHINTMYKVVHIANFNVSLHALNLLYQISQANDSINDRFYSALYKKILDPQIGNTTHQTMLLNLVFRALKRDKNGNRIKTFVKRLLQVALYMQPPMACGILFLVNQLIYNKSHLFAFKPKKANLEVHIEEEEEEEEDDEPSDVDADENKTEDDVVLNIINKPIIQETDDIEIKPDVLDTIKKEFYHPPLTEYNAFQRNPLYSGGEFCVYYELIELQNHYHPTVALYAKKILNAQHISYSGDPLKDFTLIRFLERFSFKNPKSIKDVQKPGVNPVFGKRKLQVPTGVKTLAVNSTNYLNTREDRIPIEELFMYTYLQRYREQQNDDEKDYDSDLDSVGSDEFEEMLNNMSGGKKVDDELDFMRDVGETLKNKKGKKNVEEDDDEFDEGPDEDEFSDQGNDFGDEELDDMDGNALEDDDDIEDFEDDDDEEEIVFNSDDEETPKATKIDKKSARKSKNDFSSIFASADEFASILDEENDFMAGTSNAVSNKDNADLKQLNWEQNRHKWVRRDDGPMGKGHKSKHFNKKRPKTQNAGPKYKKHKRN